MAKKKRNVELIRSIADRLRRDESCHDQDFWCKIGECGTVACIAGWALILSNYRPLFEHHWVTNTMHLYHWAIPGSNKTVDSADTDVEAAKLLGLTRSEVGIFSTRWHPAVGLTVADALDRLADGASYEEVTRVL